MPVDPGGRKRGLNQASKPPRKRQPPVTPPDQQDRQRAHRAPPATPPDQADRQATARKQNFRRGAAPTGGPGRAEVRRTNRLITRVEKGRADTREVQAHLRRQGFDLAVDNVWGPQTAEAWKLYLRGLATGQEQHAATTFARQRDYLRDFDPQKPANKRYELELFGEKGARELDMLRESLNRSIYENQTNPEHYEARSWVQERPISGALGALGKAIGGKVVEDIGELAEGDLAGAYAEEAELLTGPEMIKAAEGKDFDPRWLAFEAALIPFRPIATLRAGAKGAITLPKGVKAAKEAAKAEYRGPGLVTRGFQVGGEKFVKEGSRSSFGRSVDRAIDRLRNTNKQAGRTMAYSTKFKLDTKNLSVDLLRKVSRGLKPEQEYALRILAEGALPEERIAHHMALVEKAPTKEVALYHLEHAAWNQEAAKYVELNPAWSEGSEVPRVILRADVPGHSKRALGRLQKAWQYFQESGEVREDLLKEIGRLQDERIMYRQHAPGRVIKGARYQKFEAKIQEELEASPARQGAFKWIEREFADDPVQAGAARALYDTMIRSTAEETGLPVSEVAARIRSVESQVELDEIPELGALYQTVEATHTPGLLPFREIADNVLSEVRAKLPPSLRRAPSLTKKIDELYSLVRQGAAYRDWYQRAAGVITQVAKDMNMDPRTVAQVVAIYSQGRNPTFNLMKAAKAINEFRETRRVTGGLPGQADKAMTVLTGGNWPGRKTNSYYGNFLKHIDPEAYAKEFPGREVTVDRHIAWFFTGKDTPGSYYDGMERVFQEIADVLGWAPEEVQAAAWVPIKAGRIRQSVLNRGKKAKDMEHYLPSAADAYERGYTKYKGELFQGEDPISGGVRATLEDGGFTWNGDMTPFKGPGFAVSYEKYNVELPAERFNAQAVKSFREAYDVLLQADPNVKIGSWLDPETGNVHLDITQVVKSAKEAEELAIRENQQAYYDFDTGQAHFVEKPQDLPDVIWERAAVIESPELSDRLFEMADALRKGDISADDVGDWVNSQLFREDLVGTNDLAVLRTLRGHLPPDTRSPLTTPEPPAPAPHQGFQEAAAEELDAYAALARDVANTLPEEEWPAWVRNQIRAQAEEFPEITRRTTEGELFQASWADGEDPSSYRRMTNKDLEARPTRLFHVAPKSQRGNIEESGLQDRLTGKGVFLWDNPEDAKAYHDLVGGDIWEVSPDGLKLERDSWWDEPGRRERWPGPGRSLVSREGISPERLRLTDALTQRGGGLDAVSPYGIKGAVAFDKNDLARIFLTGAADQTTLAHEMAHVMRRVLPRVSPQVESTLAKFAGAKITNRAERSAAKKAGQPMPRPEYDWGERTVNGKKIHPEEVFADAVLKVIRGGVAPRKHKREFAALARAFSDVLDEAELPDVPFHVNKAIQRLLLDYEPKPGGRIFGHEDVKYGVGYAPTWRGVPFRMTHPHRAMASYMRRVSSHFFGGGRGRAIGAGPDDAALRKSYEGAALISGFFTKDVVGPKAESGILASRMSGAAVARQALVRAGEEVPRYADDIAVIVDPALTDNQRKELQVFWDKVKELGDRKLTGDEFDPISFKVIEAARQLVLPTEIDGKPINQVAEEIIDTGVPVENVVWVPREFMDSSGLLYVPQSTKYQEIALRKWATTAGLSWDVVNDLVKAQILWLNPAYAPVQFIGNTAMNLMHQGPFAAVSGYKSVMMLRKMALEERLMIDTWMGEGIGGVIRPRGVGQWTEAFDTLHRWNSVVSDILPRRMAFMHEARRDGLKSIDQVADLARRARAGDEAAIEQAEMIARRARRSIVDFDNMTPLEREVITRWIFFYPWLRGATDYSINFIKDHPVQAMALALMYEHYQASQQGILGDHPYYANLDVPISTDTVGLKVPFTQMDLSLSDAIGESSWETDGNPMVFKLRQALTQTTPLEILEALNAWALHGEDPLSSELVSFLTPLPYGAGVALFGYDPYEGKEVPRGPLTFLNQIGITSDENQAIPVVDRVRKLFFESDEDAKARRENALYPREKFHEALRVGLGSLAPTPYNTEIGQERAMKDAPTFERRAFELKQDGEELDLPAPSEQVLKDLQWNVRLYKGWRGLSNLEKAKRSVELFDERYGTNYREKYIPRIESEGQAKALYETLNPRLYPHFSQYRSWIRKKRDLALEAESVSD